jgi:hypothetical protein
MVNFPKDKNILAQNREIWGYLKSTRAGVNAAVLVLCLAQQHAGQTLRKVMGLNKLRLVSTQSADWFGGSE